VLSFPAPTKRALVALFRVAFGLVAQDVRGERLPDRVLVFPPRPKSKIAGIRRPLGLLQNVARRMILCAVRQLSLCARRGRVCFVVLGLASGGRKRKETPIVRRGQRNASGPVAAREALQRSLGVANACGCVRLDAGHGRAGAGCAPRPSGALVEHPGLPTRASLPSGWCSLSVLLRSRQGRRARQDGKLLLEQEAMSATRLYRLQADRRRAAPQGRLPSRHRPGAGPKPPRRNTHASQVEPRPTDVERPFRPPREHGRRGLCADVAAGTLPRGES
jgi:hypothetical protein